jgi:integrase
MASRVADDGVKVATIALGLAAIDAAHKAFGHHPCSKHPVVERTWKGIRRQRGAPQRRVAAIAPRELAKMSAVQPESLVGLRTRALLVIGFAGAFRRSELAALDVADVAFADDGVVITLPRSKTDQEGQGTKVGLPHGSSALTCPVRALRAWLAASKLQQGALFRSFAPHGGPMGQRLAAADVARIVKRAAKAAGLDPAHYSGHSLRAGLATAAARAGKSDRAIMAQGRWTTRTMVDRYVRDGRLLETENAASGIGL